MKHWNKRKKKYPREPILQVRLTRSPAGEAVLTSRIQGISLGRQGLHAVCQTNRARARLLLTTSKTINLQTALVHCVMKASDALTRSEGADAQTDMDTL